MEYMIRVVFGFASATKKVNVNDTLVPSVWNDDVNLPPHVGDQVPLPEPEPKSIVQRVVPSIMADAGNSSKKKRKNLTESANDGEKKKNGPCMERVIEEGWDEEEGLDLSQGDVGDQGNDSQAARSSDTILVRSKCVRGGKGNKSIVDVMRHYHLDGPSAQQTLDLVAKAYQAPNSDVMELGSLVPPDACDRVSREMVV